MKNIMATTQTFILASLLHHLLLLLPITLAATGGGKWNLLLSNIGVSAMHMQLLNNDLRRRFQLHPPLNVLTDVRCSSGAAMPDGSLMQTGGFNDGDHNVRVYKPCTDNSCDWQEFDTVLTQRRWYATNHILPDGRQIIVGGRGQFSYEFYPKKAGADQSYNLPFLSQTNDPRIENNLHPFVFLNVDGNLFIFANNRAILFDYVNGVVVKNYPTIPGGDPRSYPSSGSAVLLPLRESYGVVGVHQKDLSLVQIIGILLGALNTCGRIRITDPNPQWVMETMPLARVMGDMVLLPNGNVLIINGASAGTAGWDLSRNPVLTPLIYRPNNPDGLRFEVQNSSLIPRMYHSTSILLRDGRILISGSNPHAYLQFYRSTFSHEFDNGSIFTRLFRATVGTYAFEGCFTCFTSQRESLGGSIYQVRVVTPSSNILAPTGYYLLFVVYQEVPSQGIWVQIK
ncbi:hypothetical protein Pfo_021536 [Paulownia fortunei]|nr:hypothetical protein Pfo_021536 [Paulownia fortunei]